jgi:hypothetical protein
VEKMQEKGYMAEGTKPAASLDGDSE